MKKQPNTFKHFVIRLPETWLQQFFLLGKRIKNLLKNKKNMETIISICIGLMIAIPGALWAIHTGICPNCERQLGFGNSEGHFHSCQNCQERVYICPGIPNPHIAKCHKCSQSLWTCDTVNGSTAEQIWIQHGIAECIICGEPYRKCMAEKIYCPESMIFPRHRPFAGKPKPLPMPDLDIQ